MGNTVKLPERNKANETSRAPSYNLIPTQSVLAPTNFRPSHQLPVSYQVFREGLLRKKINKDDLDRLSTRISQNADQLALKKTEERLHQINLNKIREHTRFHIHQEFPKPAPSKYAFLNIGNALKKVREHDFRIFPIKTIRPDLTPKIQQRIDEALSPHPSSEVLVEIDGANLIRKDFQTLVGLNWLNDEIINAYLSLLVIRGRKSGCKKVYSFNTFFYPKLRDSGYSSIKRWTRKVDIFTNDFILVPIHLGNHWCLAFINFLDKTISYYDSLGGHVGGCCDRLLQYLKEESYDKKKQDFESEQWKLIDTYHTKKIPQQRNCSDCGVFACTYAEHLTRQAELDFGQDDMLYFRRKMVYELLTKQILE